MTPSVRAPPLLRLTLDCLSLTIRGLARSPWTLLFPIGFAAALGVAGGLLAPMGVAGSALSALVAAALAASYLSVVAQVVAGARVRVRELPERMRPLFGPVLGVLSVVWLAQFVVVPLLGTGDLGRALAHALRLALLALLSAAPEALHQRGDAGGFAALIGSIGFVVRHAVLWLAPNLALAAVLYVGLSLTSGLRYDYLIAPIAAGAWIHAAMVFRGHLFRALGGSTPTRARAPG